MMIYPSDETGMFTNAMDYIMKKNKDLYQRFTPDWTSPVGDTIHDICEERGWDYEQFIVATAEATGWRNSLDTIREIFAGKRNMDINIACYLSKSLGSTPEFWMKRSSKNLFIDEQIVDDTAIVLRRVLQECLSAQVKREDAPCSSETHLNTAITLLANMVPEYEPSDEEMLSAFEWAKKEMRVLKYGEE